MNPTRSNGILLAGTPSKDNLIEGNVHKGKSPGYLINEARATVRGNKNYT
jgi:hypothetical protein